MKAKSEYFALNVFCVTAIRFHATFISAHKVKIEILLGFVFFFFKIVTHIHEAHTTAFYPTFTTEKQQQKEIIYGSICVTSNLKTCFHRQKWPWPKPEGK